jgi:hypothetical protein
LGRRPAAKKQDLKVESENLDDSVRPQFVKGALGCIAWGGPHGFVSIVILKVLES